MAGSWHLYRAGERWRKPKHLVRALVEVPGWVAVCFSAPDVELLHELQPVLAHLGPDLCDPDADIGAAVERMGRLAAPATTIAEVLLDQRVAAGIGNVYKSEVLHACAVDPFAPVGHRRGDAAAPPEHGGPAAAGQRGQGWCQGDRAGGPWRLRPPGPAVPAVRQSRSAPAATASRAAPPTGARDARAGAGGERDRRASPVVVVGAGFGGLATARALAGEPVDVTARRPAQLPHVPAVAVPGGDGGTQRSRRRLRRAGHPPRQRNASFRQGTVDGVDWDRRTVSVTTAGGARRCRSTTSSWLPARRPPSSGSRAPPSTPSRCTR